MTSTKCDGCGKEVKMGFHCHEEYLGNSLQEKLAWQMQNYEYREKHLCYECMNKVIGPLNHGI